MTQHPTGDTISESDSLIKHMYRIYSIVSRP